MLNAYPFPFTSQPIPFIFDPMCDVIDKSFKARLRRLFRSKRQAELDYLMVENQILKELVQEQSAKNGRTSSDARKSGNSSPAK